MTKGCFPLKPSYSYKEEKLDEMYKFAPQLIIIIIIIIIIDLGRKGPLRATAYQQTAGLMPIWFQREVTDRAASLGVTCGSMSIPPAVVGFLNRNYHYKSVATRIPRDADLSLISYTSRKPIGNRTSTTSRIKSAKQHA